MIAVKRPFKPFIALMDRLRYPQKMALVAFIFLLPGLVLIPTLIYEINTTIDLTRKEISGVEYNRHIMTLLLDIQQQRGMLHALLRGEHAFREKIMEKQSQIEEHIKKIDNLNKKLMATSSITEKWNAIKIKWQDLKGRMLRLEAEKYFVISNLLVTDILDLMTQVSENYKLMFEPDVETHYQVDTMFVELPLMIEKTARIRGWGSGVATTRILTDNMKTELIALSGQVRLILDYISSNVKKSFGEKSDMSLSILIYANDVYNSTNLFLGTLDNEIIKATGIHIEPVDYFTIGTRAIDSSFALYNVMIPTLNNILQARIDRLSRKKYLIEIVSAGTLLIAFCLFAGFYLSVMNSLKTLARTSEHVADGDLKARAKMESTDEMALVAKSFNDMASVLERNITIIRQSEEETKKLLKEKELLLKEIHHRVKNNLQLISSLLNLQSGYIKESQTLGMLRESQNRIRAIADIHEILYRSEDIERVNLKTYVQRMVADLFYSYEITTGAITLNTEMEDIELDIDTAIPLGLIINELVSNSLKHAFPEDKKGEIFIGLHAGVDNKFTLTVSDNGIGLPDGMDFRNVKSLGLQLVMTLANQLNGKIELDKSGGTLFKIYLHNQNN